MTPATMLRSILVNGIRSTYCKGAGEDSPHQQTGLQRQQRLSYSIALRLGSNCLGHFLVLLVAAVLLIFAHFVTYFATAASQSRRGRH